MYKDNLSKTEIRELIEYERRKNKIGKDVELVYNKNVKVVEFKNKEDERKYMLKSEMDSYRSHKFFKLKYISSVDSGKALVYRTGDYHVKFETVDGNNIIVLSDRYAIERLKKGKFQYIQLVTYEVDKVKSDIPIDNYLVNGKFKKEDLTKELDLWLVEDDISKVRGIEKAYYDEYKKDKKKYEMID